MKAILMTLFSAGALLFLLMAYALGGNFYGDLADRFPDAREQITWMWRDVLVPFWKVLILLVGGHFFMRCVRWSANRVLSKHDTVYLGRCALWLKMEIVVAGLFALAAVVAELLPRFALPVKLMAMSGDVRWKCLGFLIDMAVAGVVYFAAWSLADGLSCWCSRSASKGCTS